MAHYLVLIYGNEQHWDNATADEMRQIDAGHRAFRAKAGTAVLSAGQVAGTNTATTLRAGASGSPEVTDGPFLETKEIVGGYYVVDAADVDEVVALTSLLAEATHHHSGIEIRPLVNHG